MLCQLVSINESQVSTLTQIEGEHLKSILQLLKNDNKNIVFCQGKTKIMQLFSITETCGGKVARGETTKSSS